MKRKYFAAVVSAVIFVFLFTTASYAAYIPYNNYTYNPDTEAVYSKPGYEPFTVLTSFQGEGGEIALDAPTDFYKKDELLYVLDSGNKRVVVLDDDLRAVDAIESFRDGNGEIKLVSPTGIFVDKSNRIYIADPESHAVFIFDSTGLLVSKLEKPPTDMLDDALEYRPTKVLCDTGGNCYVIAPGVYQGAVIYDKNGIFKGFFGNNRVESSLDILSDMFWKNFLTDEQTDKLARYTPDEFDNFDIDGRNFVYTSTQASKVWVNRVKKLNPMGVNVFSPTIPGFGELQNVYKDGKYFSSTIVDIDVDDNGYINVVDTTYGRVYRYDSCGKLIFILGGLGFQSGTFLKPVAIESSGDKILVLDRDKGSITVFKPTDFGKKVHSMLSLYNDGKYDDAFDLCNEILKIDRNYYPAYQSIGKSLYEKGEYKDSARYFKMADDREGNSLAFKAYRDSILRRMFLIVAAVLILSVTVLIFIAGKVKRSGGGLLIKTKAVFKTTVHPFLQFEDMKYRKVYPIKASVTVLVLLFMTSVLKVQFTSFRFNSSYGSNINIILCFIQTIPLFAIWCFSNWSVCTLLEGKGRLIEISSMSSLCLIPYVVSQYLAILLSHFLSLDESIIISALSVIGIAWSVIMLLCGIAATHQYGFKKTALSIIFSVIGMLVAIFIILLVSELLWKGIMFVASIVFEISYRLKM